MHGGIEKRSRIPSEEQLLDESVGPTLEWKSLSGRLEFGKPGSSEFGPLRLNLETQELMSASSGKAVRLEPLEYQVLWLLMRAQGEEVPIDEIEEFLYRERTDEHRPDSNIITVTVGKLRRVLEVVGAPFHIPKIEGKGFGRYRLADGAGSRASDEGAFVAKEADSR